MWMCAVYWELFLVAWQNVIFLRVWTAGKDWIRLAMASIHVVSWNDGFPKTHRDTKCLQNRAGHLASTEEGQWRLCKQAPLCDSDALVDLFGHWLKSSETDPLTVSLWAVNLPSGCKLMPVLLYPTHTHTHAHTHLKLTSLIWLMSRKVTRGGQQISPWACHRHVRQKNVPALTFQTELTRGIGGGCRATTHSAVYSKWIKEDKQLFW